MKRALLGLIAMIVASPALAQDHLEPEDSIFASRANRDNISTGYERDVVAKFAEFYNWGVHARAIVLPSFQTEYGIAFMGDSKNQKVVGLRAAAMIWNYSLIKLYEGGQMTSRDRNGIDKTKEDLAELRALVPPKIEDLEMSRCELPIVAEDARLFKSVWKKMLRATRFPDRSRIGFDGVTYHFSGDFDHQSLAGKVWSPKGQSETAALAKIAAGLYSACSENDTSKFLIARQEAEALCNKIGCDKK